MPSRVFRVLSLLALGIALTVSTTASAQLRFAPGSAPPVNAVPTSSAAMSRVELEDLLLRGQDLEANKRWDEALTLYEKALRNHPGEQQIERRFRNSKLHYDLARRYSDGSFQRALTAMSEREALGLYNEVLLKIQSHYVDRPDWKTLVLNGANGFDVAMTDERFASRQCPQASPETIYNFRLELRRQVEPRPIVSREQAAESVRRISQLAQQRLGIQSTAAIFEFLCGATNSLDDYSSYLTADQLDEVYSQIDGNFVGLGVELQSTEGALTIVRVIPGGPAERGGVRAGDRILAVDSQSTVNYSTDEAADLLQGEEGTFVELVVAGPNEASRTLRLRREQVDVPSVDEVKIVEPTSGIAYLRLNCFQKTTTRELDAALTSLDRQGMRSLIMDLRRNPGGLLTSSVEVADKFVDQGIIVSTRGRNPGEDYNYSAHRPGTWSVPLVVLIDGDSASASEIFAGAIRDHRRGTIVGTRSYGKGSVQGIFPLTYAQAGIRLTTAKFYSPLGRPFSKVGVEPDIVVQMTAKPVNGTLPVEDPVLDRAIEVARGQFARR